jgi:DNA repair exonuclease SbcCD nuclease subunit
MIGLFTDLHITLYNEKEVLYIIRQIIDVCNVKHIKQAICIGDVFESRKSQPLLCLKTFEKILIMFNEAKIHLICLSGNHDKTNYQSEDSFLDPFQNWPNFKLIRKYEFIDDNYGRFHFIPYFDEETTYLSYLNRVDYLKDGKNYLFTHIGIDGVINNDGNNVYNPVKKDLFKGFDKVFIGHFHNQSKVGKNIFYIGSIMPKDFGEDNNKGCSILNGDGSHEHITLSFKKYEKVVVNVDNFTKDKEQELLKKYSNHNDNIRFEFIGDPSKIKSLDKMKFETVGIDVVTKNKEVEETVNVAEHDKFVTFDDKMILEQEFPEFCEKNELTDIEIGTNYLKQKLEENEK